MSVSHALKRGRTWPAWSGTKEEVGKIGEVAEQLCNDRRIQLIEELRREIAEEDRSFNPLEDAQRIVDRTFHLVMKVQDGDDLIEGPTEEVIEEIDARTIKSASFEISYPSIRFSEKININLGGGRLPWLKSVSVEVESADRSWGRLAFVRICEEVEKGIPRWAWIHNSKLSPIRSIGVFLILSISLFAAFSFDFEKIGEVENVNMASIILATSASLSFMLNSGPVISWIFPRFELVSDGSPSTGSRRIAFMISLAASIPIGIFVNKIS